MSEIIDSYEQDLVENLNQANQRIATSIDTKQDWKQFRALLSECEKGMKIIETELIGQPAPFKAAKNAKLREHKRRYDQIKRAAFEKENNWELEMGKRELMGKQPSIESIKSYDRTTEATDRLRESVKVMYESEEISDNVGNELRRQTDKLISSKGKVQEIRHDLGKSERKIKSMMLRIRKNKFVLRGVIAFIVIVLVVVLVSYFR